MRIVVRTTTRTPILYCMPLIMPKDLDAKTLASLAVWASPQTSRGCIISVHHNTSSTASKTSTSSSASLPAAKVRIFGIYTWYCHVRKPLRHMLLRLNLLAAPEVEWEECQGAQEYNCCTKMHMDTHVGEATRCTKVRIDIFRRRVLVTGRVGCILS